MHGGAGRKPLKNPLTSSLFGFKHEALRRHEHCLKARVLVECVTGIARLISRRRLIVNLIIWIPALVFLGLVIMGLMFAFVIGCEKV
jgi:hypothetical protein